MLCAFLSSDKKTYHFKIEYSWLNIERHNLSSSCTSEECSTADKRSLAKYASENASIGDSDTSQLSQLTEEPEQLEEPVDFEEVALDEIPKVSDVHVSVHKSTQSKLSTLRKTVGARLRDRVKQTSVKALTTEIYDVITRTVKLEESCNLKIKETSDIADSTLRSTLREFQTNLIAKNKDEIWFVPIGLHNCGVFNSQHSVLAIIKADVSWVVESKKLKTHHRINTLRTGFQGTEDSTNCTRYVAYTAINLLKHLIAYPHDYSNIPKLIKDMAKPDKQVLEDIFDSPAIDGPAIGDPVIDELS